MPIRPRDSQPELFDSFLASPPKNEVLRRLNALLDWDALGRLVEPTYSDDPRGRTALDPRLMIKVLLLQRLYGLSDPLIEQEIGDRLSFREFLGVRAKDRAPDETSIVRFRDRLRAHGLFDTLRLAIDAQLAARGVAVRAGSIKIIDASLIQAATNPPRQQEADSQNGAEQNAGSGRKDCDADFTMRNGGPHFGYKLHAAQDRQTGLISAHAVTVASTHDSQVFEQLLDGDEAEVLADKAYDSAAHRALLRKNKTQCSILRKAVRNKPLSWWHAGRNRTLSKTRNFIEGTFGTLKNRFDLKRARYVGLARVKEQFSWTVLAYNLRRAAALSREQCA